MLIFDQVNSQYDPPPFPISLNSRKYYFIIFTRMNPIKMTAMLSSFFLRDSLTVNDGGGAVTATTIGDADETVATSGARESASRIDRSSISFLLSTMLALSPLICSKTLDVETPGGSFFLSLLQTFFRISAAAELLAVKWRFLRA